MESICRECGEHLPECEEHVEGMWRAFGGYTEQRGGHVKSISMVGIWKACGEYLEGTWRAFGGYVENVRRACGEHLAGM